LTLIEIRGKRPVISIDCFVADNATLAGDIQLSEACSIWFGSSIRAEFEKVVIGSHSNVQDNCTIHTDEGFPCTIGEVVSIGHGAVVHGAAIGSNCLVGMGAILLNGSKVGSNSMVAAGSLLVQGAAFPEGSLILGSPAKAVRNLRDEEIEGIKVNARHYDEFRAEYLKASKKV